MGMRKGLKGPKESPLFQNWCKTPFLSLKFARFFKISSFIEVVLHSLKSIRNERTSKVDIVLYFFNPHTKICLLIWEREKQMLEKNIDRLPGWGLNLQPTFVLWPGIELAAFLMSEMTLQPTKPIRPGLGIVLDSSILDPWWENDDVGPFLGRAP